MMPDRGKVIKAIEGCINDGSFCNKCDYDGCVFQHGSCEKDLLADALALLKEQKIEEPHPWEHIWDAPDYTFKGRCRNCGFIHYFIQGHDAQYRFCPQCGEQKVI